MDPAHALWIGGGQGSGKSSVARALSARFDLQQYGIDRRVQAHVPRMAPHPFLDLSFDERWVEPDAATMVEWFVELARDRLRLVLEDLAALPDSPGVVVEGPQLFPSLVESLLVESLHVARDQALLLLPLPEEQRERLAARGPMTQTSEPELARAKAVERDLMLAERIESEAREHGYATLVVDAPLDAMIERGAAHFAPVLDRLPRAVNLAEIRRIENDALAKQVRLYVASEGALRPEDATLPFRCECSAPGCDPYVEIPLATCEALAAAGLRYSAHTSHGGSDITARE